MKIDREAWSAEQAFEQDWWSDCRNTFGEQAKHITYARRMGMVPKNDGGRWPLIDMYGMSVLDIGGGPVSMLLECQGLDRGVVVDPCAYPAWTSARYASVGIEVVQQAAEDYVPDQIFDEAWCYNVLQHTADPEEILHVMSLSAKVIRIFEWIDFAPSPGHPHELTEEGLRKWLPQPRVGDWLWASEVYWDLNIAEPMFGGMAFHGYVSTGL